MYTDSQSYKYYSKAELFYSKSFEFRRRWVRATFFFSDSFDPNGLILEYNVLS